MENAADVHVELVKLVDGLSCAHVPQHAVVENQVIRGVEGGAVPLVVVGQVWVVQRQRHLTRLDVIDLGGREEISIQDILLHDQVDSNMQQESKVHTLAICSFVPMTRSCESLLNST